MRSLALLFLLVCSVAVVRAEEEKASLYMRARLRAKQRDQRQQMAVGAFVFGVAFATIWIFAAQLDRWKGAFIGAAVILFFGWAAYFFYFQQLFVKRWGGVMSVTVPEGQMHIAATWKDDNLWIENYDPSTNRCIFTEYSKANLLEGKVTIKKCNPLLPAASGQQRSIDSVAP